MIALSESITSAFRRQLIVITSLIAFVIPAIYFTVSYQYIGGNIDAESEFAALTIERIVANNPDSWRFEDIRIRELLLRRLTDDRKDSRIVRDMQGNIIVEMSGSVPGPLITRSHAIYDSGSQVAVVEISRSLLPLITTTAAISAVSVTLAIIMFFAFRMYPPRMVREAVSSILKSERRLRRAETIAYFGNWEYIPDSDQLFISEGAAAIFGLDGDKYSADDFLEIILPEFRSKIKDGLEALVYYGEPYNMNYRVRSPNGKIVDIQSIAEYDPNNKIVFGVVQDITERVRAESEKNRLEAQLQQAQKMETVGQLAGGIAHDFNNILLVISGFASSLRRQLAERDHKALNSVDVILDATERAASLTQSLLTFSRKQPSNPQLIELNTVIRVTKKMISAIAGDNIGIELKLTDQNTCIFADSNQITQILMNLSSNARDSMPDGGKLLIETRNLEEEDNFLKARECAGKFVLMTFSDTGTGMTEETRQRIFEPFYTTKQVGKGTGLGLSMVYGLVEQHNGFIDVESSVGMGTTFRIYLPEMSVSIRPKILAAPIKYEGLAGTIAIIDDNKDLRRALCGMAQSFGLSVIEAVDGDDAVEKIRAFKGRMDLVLMDVIMLYKNGTEEYKEIKKLKPNVKLILMSSYSKDFISERLMMEEKFSIISKPIATERLFEEICKCLETP